MTAEQPAGQTVVVIGGSAGIGLERSAKTAASDIDGGQQLVER